MLKVSDLSENCYKSELDLFTIPPTQTAIESGIWDTILPVGGFDKNPNVEFVIPGNSLHYIDLSQTEFYVKLNVQAKQGTNPIAWSSRSDASTIDAIPVNNFLHSLFQDITVRFNTSIVEQCQYMYPYRAYLEDLLNYDGESKSTFLNQQGFFKDDAGRFENYNTTKIDEVPEISFIQPEKDPYDVGKSYVYANVNPTPDQKIAERTTVIRAKQEALLRNEGAIKRRNFLLSTNLIKGKLHLDTFNMNRYLLNSVDVHLNLKKNTRQFCLMYNSDDDLFNINIESMYLKVRRVVVSPSIMLNHAMALEKTNAKYPIKKVLVKPITLNFGSNSQTLSNIHTGIMPNRIVLAFVNTNAMTGSFKLNPFYFQHFNMESVAIKIASQNVPYSTPLEFRPKDNNHDVIEAYNSLFTGIREAPNDISYNEYKNGNFIFAFDLTPDLCSSEHYNILKDGNLEIVLRFNNLEVPQIPITMITYLEFDNILEVTKSRNVLCNYQ